MVIQEKRTYSVATVGFGKPDYAMEISRAKQTAGYSMDLGEVILWMTIVSCPPDRPAGATPFAINGIGAGVEVAILDCFTGFPYHDSAPGTDYIIKEFWSSFNQPHRFTIYQGGAGFQFNDTACIAYFAANEKPVNSFLVGWRRSLLENTALPGRFVGYVRNEGGGIMYGKCWIAGYEKTGSYVWM